MREDRDRRDQNNGGSDDNTIEGGKRQTRRIFLWVLCGGYLLYLAYNLGSGLFTGQVPAGVERVVSGVACVAFSVIGVVLLISAARLWVKSLRASAQAMRGETDEPDTPELFHGDRDDYEEDETNDTEEKDDTEE